MYCYLVESVKEKTICVKFCFKVRKTAAGTHSMLHKVCSNDAFSQGMTYEWFTHFKNGNTSVGDECSGSG
jgi:hypothetical protein